MSKVHIEKVYKALLQKGFPSEFCEEIAVKYMNTEYTSKRMCGYLYSVENPRVEDVVDEMFAIISDRDRFVEKHASERANKAITDLYNNGIFGKD